MDILAISDKEDSLLSARIERAQIKGPGVVVSCGDLRPGYLDCIATTANAPLLFVRGNHDTDERGYLDMGGTPLDGDVVRIDGLNFAGLDGSYAYREGIVGFTEGEMRGKVLLLAAKALARGGIDVLVTHAPPRGYGDLDDLPHRGFKCFNWLLDRFRPRLLLHGHTHLDYGIIPRELQHPSGTRIVNAFGFWAGEV